MQRFDPPRNNVWQSHPMRLDVAGQYVRYDDATATIARLTAERDQALAEAAAAYERAAQIAKNGDEGPDLPSWLGARVKEIRALATEPGTTALAEMLDAETRACAEVFSHPEAKMVRDRILARIDQRKEARG